MSVTSSLPEVHSGSLLRRIVVAVLALVVLVVAVAAGWAYWIAHSALPQVVGSVVASGLSSKVRIVRDAQGVPTIEAATLEDLFFAQGYVTAQDRLWQMDIMRRAAAGELSEIIGDATLKMDRAQRILGLRVVAEAAEKTISARDRAYFDAYARGVNAFIESHRNRLPLEFRLLRYQPRPWTVTDSLLVGARMVQDLNHYSYARALTREKILAKIGPELTADLYVNSSWRDRPPTDVRRGMDEDPAADSGDEDDDEEVDPDGGGTTITSAQPAGDVREGLEPTLFPSLNGAAEGVAEKVFSERELSPQRLKPHSKQCNYRSAEALHPVAPNPGAPGTPALRHPKSRIERSFSAASEAVPFQSLSIYVANFWDNMPQDADAFRPGSNNWVVSGQHTITGKPLLSNDMHLDHQMPNLWFEAHLKSGNFDVAGVTLPGVPFVIVGHNQRIGWGFTNVGPTVEDDFIEEFNAQGQYKTPTGWKDAQHRQEIIRVKGKPDVTLDVVATRHGPIITDIIPGETRPIALRWTLYDGMGLTLFDVDSAQNWEEFRKAFSMFAAPGQNVMYADVDGNIGYQSTGRVPIRASGDGSLPVNGSDDAHEWKGFIPFDEMPHIYNPPTGILATANGRITPDGYKYSISTEWETPWRTDRIYRVLESGKKFGPADMLALQMDIYSTFDHFCADKFVYALDHAPSLSDRAKKAADILRDWDGRMSADSAAPTIETKARQELVRLLLEPKLGAAADSSPKGPARSAAPNAAAAKETGTLSWKSYRWGMSTVWLENVLSKQPARWLPLGYSDYGNLLTAAVENALKQPGVPSDIAQLKWGENYPVEIDHPVLSQLPLIGRFTGPGRHPLSGDSYTVRAVGHNFGASERATWNFANFDESTLNLVTGESGVFLSPHYMDQWTAWYGGSTFTLPFTQIAIERHRAHEMTLEPK